MPIRIKTDLDFGQVFYVKNDPDQFEYILVGIKILPSNQIKFILSLMGEECEVYDFECSTDPDKLKLIDKMDED